MSAQGDRVAKAWRVKLEWSDDHDIVLAPTRSAAKAALWRELRDSYSELQFADLAAWRAPESDRVLPAEHRLVAELTEEEREIVMHAFGASNRRDPGYRDHYCTSPTDARLHRLAWELGLFRGPFGESSYGCSPGWVGVFYYLTDLGKLVARSMMPTYPN